MEENSIRLDKYLWAVRLYKTRSDASEAVKSQRVMLNDAYVKPSREIHVGDEISIRRPLATLRYRILEMVANRQPAKNVPRYCIDITPEEEKAKLNVPRETIFVFRERGTGRPTKKDRRQIDAVMNELYENE